MWDNFQIPEITPISSLWIWWQQQREDNYKAKLQKIIQEHREDIDRKLQKMQNYDKWIFLIEHFEDLKQIEESDKFLKYTFIENPKRNSDEIKWEIYKNILENELYIKILNKLLPTITEINPQNKSRNSLDFLLSFPDSEEWEKEAIFCFAKQFKFKFLWYLLPKEQKIQELLASLRSLEKWKWKENRITIKRIITTF